MTKQDRFAVQEAIDRAQAEIDKATSMVQELIDDADDDDEKEALEALLDDLDTQLPAVRDYFPEDK